MSATETNWVEAIGAPAYQSIVDMVAALECDYDRLEELRDERDDWEPMEGDELAEWLAAGKSRPAESWADQNPDEAEELKELEAAAGDCESREDAEQRIQDDPLSLRIFGERVNGEWEADKLELLLSTGGPAVRIMGELDESGEPSRAWLEVQDWWKPWTQYFPADGKTLLTYCRCFYFAE